MSSISSPSPSENSAESFDGSATYCPEDNKLRLYVGRVPRDEFLKLRAEGWRTLHKQREAGGGDFVAVWTPERHNTALAYAGVIEDEDMGPAERAADRAERFALYRDKRTNEATGHADNYDDQPTAHGFQSPHRAARAAARHDRHAARACDSWSKAEYWTQRTAGVIAHSLHVSSPEVRMGRIKELESLQRKITEQIEELRFRFRIWSSIAAMEDAAHQTERAKYFVSIQNHWADYTHPVTGRKDSLYRLLHDEQQPISGAQAASLYLASHRDPDGPEFQTTRLADWANHYALRLAYENQMLAAQGGRAAFIEMQVGGWVNGYQIRKINRSHVTKRIVSVQVKGLVKSWQGVTKPQLITYTVERLSPDVYRPPTPADLEALKATLAAEKAARPQKDPCPLINPTDEDAGRLVRVWNERRLAEFHQRHGNNAKYYTFKPCTIERITQAVYSANSKGAYARVETRTLHGRAELGDHDSDLYSRAREERAARLGKPFCKIRAAGVWEIQVLILTDKPQKPLPASVWEGLGDQNPAEQPAEPVQAELI